MFFTKKGLYSRMLCSLDYLVNIYEINTAEVS
jgi:hypothetical protein